MSRQILTFDGYVRVSAVMGREGDSFLSPALQRKSIGEWAKRQNRV